MPHHVGRRPDPEESLALLVLLFAALLVAGCGEKSSSEGSESVSENPTTSREAAKSSANTTRPAPSRPPVAGSPSEEPSDSPNLRSGADIERRIKESVDDDSLQKRNDLYYQVNESSPYSGWAKKTYDSGQVATLQLYTEGLKSGVAIGWHENGQTNFEGTYKDGERDSFWTLWHENGQKAGEVSYKDGKKDGLWMLWHENGQKYREKTYKDDEEVER